MPARKFRKRPVVVEAEQHRVSGSDRPFKDEGAMYHGGNVIAGEWCPLLLKTRRGWVYVAEGDWVVRERDDVFDVVKPDVFAATYESVED